MEDFDINACKMLSSQLGYSGFNENFKTRFQEIKELKNHHLVVAENCDNKTVVAWMHIEIRYYLETDFKSQICAIVVEKNQRGTGIGKKLLEYAEKWSLDAGMTEIILYSNLIRAEAHKFYEKNGYTNLKTSKYFKKDLFQKDNE